MADWLFCDRRFCTEATTALRKHLSMCSRWRRRGNELWRFNQRKLHRVNSPYNLRHYDWDDCRGYKLVNCNCFCRLIPAVVRWHVAIVHERWAHFVNLYRVDPNLRDSINPVWCFLENVRDHNNPKSGCFSDTTWSAKDGRFWSSLACKGLPPIADFGIEELPVSASSRVRSLTQTRYGLWKLSVRCTQYLHLSRV